jgi:excisionase family DNA binding protein
MSQNEFADEFVYTHPRLEHQPTGKEHCMARPRSAQVNLGKGYLGTKDVASILGVSVTSIQKMVGAGTLKAFRTSGGHRRISIESVKAAAEQMGVPWKDRIPAAAEEAASGTRRGGVAVVSARTPAKILLIDDGAASSRPISNLIKRYNGNVEQVVVNDSAEALVRTSEERPDLIVTELTVQPLDGFSLIKAIRSSPRLRNVGVVVVTSMTTEEITQRGGLPDDVVVYHKPLASERLAGFIDGMLHLRGHPAA